MLDARDEDAIALAVALAHALRNAHERKEIGLSAAACEYDLAGANAMPQGPRQRGTATLELVSGFAPERVQRVGIDAGKVADVIALLCPLCRFAQGGGCRVVKVYGRLALIDAHVRLRLVCE